MALIESPIARTTRAVFVAAAADRFGGALDYLNGRFDCKISGRDTAGDFCVFETFRTVRGGPPLHVHLYQDEWFFALDGAFVFKIGDETIRAKAGDSVFAPRKVPHAFANVTETGRLIVGFQPAGTIEKFFLESQQLSRSCAASLDDWQALGRPHGIKIVGPSLALD
jgi:mannose-6-phosphate isomerase-like protein (cupin superfamily)